MRKLHMAKKQLQFSKSVVPSLCAPSVQDVENVGEPVVDLNIEYLPDDSCIENVTIGEDCEPQPQKVFSCTFINEDGVRCSKFFKTRQYLRQHQSVHSVQKLPCEYCKKMLASKRTLKIHYKVHNLGEHFTCTECNVTFPRKNIWASHTTETNCGGSYKKVDIEKATQKNYTIIRYGYRRQLRKLKKNIFFSTNSKAAKEGI